MTQPHYLRFARSLALVSGIGCAAGCGIASTPDGDAGPTSPDAGHDAAVIATEDGGICATCTCGLTADDAGLPYCSGDAIFTCNCAVAGPLAPPELA